LIASCISLKGSLPFDYELSVDETPVPTPTTEFLFYLVALEEIIGDSPGRGSSAGPKSGCFKRSDHRGDVAQEFWLLVNACASVLAARSIAFSVYSGEGTGPYSGPGSGVDRAITSAIGNCPVEFKLSDTCQEIPGHAMAYSPFPGE
jgi:hypothetical protein